MDRLAKFQCLIAVREFGTFSVAAHELGISQPALTRSIQALEASVGSRLVDRSSKGALLTPIGEMVVQDAQRLLREVEDLEHEIDQVRGVGSGHLTIGAGPLPSLTLMPSLLARIGREFPGLQMEFQIGSWRLLTEQLKRRQLDMVVAEASDAEADMELEVTLLRRRPGCFVIRRDHPLAAQSAITPADLASYPMATPSLPNRLVAVLQGVFGIRWRPNVQCDDYRLLLDLIRASDAVSVSSLDLVEATPDLVPVVFDEAPLETRFGIIRVAGRTPSQAVRIAIDRLLALDRQPLQPPS